MFDVFKKRPHIKHHEQGIGDFISNLFMIGLGTRPQSPWSECTNMSKYEYLAFCRKVPIEQIRSEEVINQRSDFLHYKYQGAVLAARHLRSRMRRMSKRQMNETDKTKIKEYEEALKSQIEVWREGVKSSLPYHPVEPQWKKTAAVYGHDEKGCGWPKVDRFAHEDPPVEFSRDLPKDLQQADDLLQEVATFVDGIKLNAVEVVENG